MPDFNMQQNFPIASVIDAAVRNKALNQQAQQQNQENLIQGINAIGSVGQSLYNRKVAMAQALAGAKMYANTPEGQQMLAPTSTTTAIPPTVTQNQTAAYDPTSGSLTPNVSPTTAPAPQNAPVATLPKMTSTTTTPSPIGMNDLQTAFLGEKPSDVMNQLFQRAKERQQMGIEDRKQTLAEQTEPQKLANEYQLQKILAGFTGQQRATEAMHVTNEDTDSLLARRADLAKDLPTGYWNSINNEKAESAKQQIALIDYALAKKGYRGSTTQKSPDSSYQTPGGVSYTVNP